ncbi:MAG: hypothetical protein EOO09_15315 [Chitinophagaceae bacterium]|nr:MAG: hypothetical protein EOO09_15315 [Chitinophagaceae bacterium]
MAGISSSSMTGKSPNRLKYNRKEQQSKEFSDAKGLDWTDYGARMYDNQLGRWHHVDDFAEKYYDFSPYTSVLNNLIVFKDVDGRDIVNYNARGEKLGTFNLNGLNIGARN